MEELKHECGVAMIRLLKPISYYAEKYGTWQYGLNKLYLLMEKQRNRGQEGAGIGCVSLNAYPGTEYIFRERAMGANAIQEVFDSVGKSLQEIPAHSPYSRIPFCGEAYMGHLRYSTTGRSGISYVHPFLRRNNWRSRSLMLCGNFNLTNVDEIFEQLVAQGQHPRLYSDTLMMLEMMGNYLDREVQRQYEHFKPLYADGPERNRQIAGHLDIARVLRRSAETWDGGYVICGITGNTDMFALRDPCGIRPAFYYRDEEIVVLASERPVIQTVMNVSIDDIHELEPGQAMIVRQNGEFLLEQIRKPENVKPCSFERIYFSRGSDHDIYRERKSLGEMLVHPILKTVDYDLQNTVFSFIPNTAEVAYYGMMEGMDDYLRSTGQDFRVRQEKVAIKDIKLRTFITEGSSREDLAAHVYDITYGSIRPYQDNLVVIDDSIVRGTTLRQSIIGILDRLHPKKIIIVSSSPQVRFPDCYGIDMNRMDEFAAFRATIALLKERGKRSLIEDVYRRCKLQENLPKEEIVNYVKEIYEPFTQEEIADKMARILTPPDTEAEVHIVFQTIEGLHLACPKHPGDWYFSGDYPTPGGNKVVNKAFIKYYEDQIE